MKPRVYAYIPPERPKIAIVGEAPGDVEAIQRKPFVGPAGKELTEMCRMAGVNRFDCYITNVFLSRPPYSKIENWCKKKAEVGGKDYPYLPLSTGKYVETKHIEDVSPADIEKIKSMQLLWNIKPELEVFEPKQPQTVMERLALELSIIKPNVVIALGNTACWALLKQTGITKLRGSVTYSRLVPDLKVLPTFHPAAILRNWTNRSISIVDLLKAKNESHSRKIKRTSRSIWINPTLADLENFWNLYLKDAEVIAFDIETKIKTITCIGFAATPNEALVVPFFDPRKNGNYWTQAEEILAWKFVEKVLASPNAKVAHNGTYDIQYLMAMGFIVNNYLHDTMILQHAQQLEMPKALGFLATIYTNEMPWKLLRPRGEASTKSEE